MITSISDNSYNEVELKRDIANTEKEINNLLIQLRKKYRKHLLFTSLYRSNVLSSKYTLCVSLNHFPVNKNN